jgi:mannose-6-phosphate isomerase-like protein (cupin superfamily)
MKRLLCLALVAVSLHPAAAHAQSLLVGSELSGTWFNPLTPGQGLFLDIKPDLNLLFGGWFTYKDALPSAQDTENHRWFTLQDSLQGAGGEFRLYLTGNGVFNDPRATQGVATGVVRLDFSDCNNASFEYQFNGELAESFAIERLLPVAESHCEPLRNPSFQLFDANGLAQRRGTSSNRFTPFLLDQDTTAGMYYLAPGANDTQSPHDQDEVYIVLSGNGTLQAGAQAFAAVPGKVLYVRAGVPHMFTNITEELELLVIFSSAASSAGDPAALSFDLDVIQDSQSTTNNDWQRFLDVESMHMGSYSLPFAAGGDGRITHQVDEINFVTRGDATFHVGNESLRVSPGSIVWVGEGNSHFFNELSGDFTVVILFHQKPGVSTP